MQLAIINQKSLLSTKSDLTLPPLALEQIDESLQHQLQLLRQYLQLLTAQSLLLQNLPFLRQKLSNRWPQTVNFVLVQQHTSCTLLPIDSGMGQLQSLGVHLYFFVLEACLSGLKLNLYLFFSQQSVDLISQLLILLFQQGERVSFLLQQFFSLVEVILFFEEFFCQLVLLFFDVFYVFEQLVVLSSNFIHFDYFLLQLSDFDCKSLFLQTVQLIQPLYFLQFRLVLSLYALLQLFNLYDFLLHFLLNQLSQLNLPVLQILAVLLLELLQFFADCFLLRQMFEQLMRHFLQLSTDCSLFEFEFISHLQKLLVFLFDLQLTTSSIHCKLFYRILKLFFCLGQLEDLVLALFELLLPFCSLSYSQLILFLHLLYLGAHTAEFLLILGLRCLFQFFILTQSALSGFDDLLHNLYLHFQMLFAFCYIDHLFKQIFFASEPSVFLVGQKIFRKYYLFSEFDGIE